MNDAEKLDRIRAILAEPITDTERVTLIAQVFYPPEPEPVEKDQRGWPVLPDPGEWTDSGSGPGYGPYDPRD
jgi:hypothetical protein